MTRCSLLGKGRPWTLRSSPLLEITPDATTISGVGHCFPAARLGGRTLQGRGHNLGRGREPREGRSSLGIPARRRHLGEAGSTELEWGWAPGRAGGGEGPVLVSLRAERCPRLAGARSLTKEQDVVDLSPNHREEMIVNFL